MVLPGRLRHRRNVNLPGGRFKRSEGSLTKPDPFAISAKQTVLASGTKREGHRSATGQGLLSRDLRRGGTHDSKHVILTEKTQLSSISTAKKEAARGFILPWLQRSLRLAPVNRGFHLITREVLDVLPELSEFRVGILHIFIQHTSASLSINENADPDVPRDLERMFNVIAPEEFPYRHTCEGPDDMPAHVKASLLGSSVWVPITDGRLALGTWQGIYLCEHRDHGGARNLVLTISGERS
jgi:secondary thiamine-phosphate synthase enzyme